ncbi:hypothetical protein B0H19DRAFT_470901 [Mycena capillaripes]|nr:hypothetical protein B0H19DRAFT_470901 [Mycena capillaripes]
MPSQPLQESWNPFGHQYPDDDAVKVVTLQLQLRDMSRHVLMYWTNGTDPTSGGTYKQLTNLTGGPGSYAFYHPSVHLHSLASQEGDIFFALGSFTRAQRDQIADLARGLAYNMHSRVNTCNPWLWLVVKAMLDQGLIDQETFDGAVREIKLRKPEPESTLQTPVPQS